MNEPIQDRFSILAPIDHELKKQIAIDLLFFFFPLNCHKLRAELSLEAIPNIQPFSLGQFFEWARKDPSRTIYERLRQHIISIAKNMVQSGLLSFEGRTSAGILGEGDLFYSAHERSTGARKGTLFLGRALGASYIAHEIQKALVATSGSNADGDIAIGTGIHVHPEYVLTCDHVLRDMTVDNTLSINGTPVSIIECLINKTTGVDVGIVRVQPEVPLALPDLMFRDSNLLEEVLVAGFPTVPTTIEQVATFQRGEICQTNVPTLWHTHVDLFSAIARPGNSGGPLVTLEGNIVGIVTQSLEREREVADRISVFPFFASVPAADIHSTFTLLSGLQLPWETYQ
jgi:S1-C subfamily serine protease